MATSPDAAVGVLWCFALQNNSISIYTALYGVLCRGYSSICLWPYNVTVRLCVLLSWALCRGNVSGCCCRSLINSYFRIIRLTYIGGFLGVYTLLVLLSGFAVSVRLVGVWWLIWRAMLFWYAVVGRWRCPVVRLPLVHALVWFYYVNNVTGYIM